jgi:biopolymer transport protein ExbB/TolQ
MGLVSRVHLLNGFQADNTGMSYVIAAVFGAGLVVSFLAACQLHREGRALGQAVKSGSIPPSGKGNDLATLFRKLEDFRDKGETMDISTLFDTYHARHNSRARSVSILAALVISMGLLGTVVGLIMSISGLGGMVENVGLSRATMMEALKTTVAGMGTAFYTTYFGAMAGLILRAVAVSQQNTLSELCAEALEYAEEHLSCRLESKEEELNQRLAKIISSFDGMQREIESVTARLSESFSTTMRTFGLALAEAGDQAMATTRDSIAGMTDQMARCGQEIGNSVGRFNASIEEAGTEVVEAIGSIHATIDQSDHALETAFEGMNERIESAGEGLTTSFDRLSDGVSEAGNTLAGSLADFKLGMDDTTTELGKAVGELHAAIGEATGEIKMLSQARLDAEATEIAGHLSIAAESIQQFLLRKKQLEENQKVA